MEDFQNSISLTNLLQSSNLAIPHLSSQQSIIAFGKYLRLCSIEALNYDLRQRARADYRHSRQHNLVTDAAASLQTTISLPFTDSAPSSSSSLANA